MPGITIGDAVAAVIDQWVRDGAFSTQTLEKFSALAYRFAAFSTAKGVQRLDDVDEYHVYAFTRARGHARNGEVVTPAVATMQNRRAVLRAFYKTARLLRLTFADPARDIALPERTGSTTRPLTDDEAELVWFHGWEGGRDTRRAATIGLLLTGVQSGEAGHITVADLDLENMRVYAHGSSKYTPRWLDVEDKVMRALCIRAERSMDRQPETSGALVRLATNAQGSDAQLQARVGMTVHEVFQHAGLADDPTLKPSSVTAHAGVRAFAPLHRVEDAAFVLGVMSLDTAANAIGYRWSGGVR